jgi:hypothetical protein
MVRLGFTEHLSDDDMLALLRRVHRLANPDSEFDFHDSFWRYEVAVSRQRGGEMAVSPNDLLLEVQGSGAPSENHASGAKQASPLSRLQAMFGPNQTGVGPSEEVAPGLVDAPALSLRVENLEVLMGGTRQSEQMGIPFDRSLNGLDL